jgi:hypothetical protein
MRAVRAAGLRTLASERLNRSFEQLRFPLDDRVGMNVETLRQLGDRLIALDGRDRHLLP